MNSKKTLLPMTCIENSMRRNEELIILHFYMTPMIGLVASDENFDKIYKIYDTKKFAHRNFDYSNQCAQLIKHVFTFSNFVAVSAKSFFHMF